MNILLKHAKVSQFLSSVAREGDSYYQYFLVLRTYVQSKVGSVKTFETPLNPPLKDYQQVHAYCLASFRGVCSRELLTFNY